MARRRQQSDALANAVEARAAWRVFSVTSLGVVLCFVSSSSLGLALPAIVRDLGASPGQASWIVLSYLLFVTSLILAFGRLSDIVGRRDMYLCGLGLLTLASLGCGLSTSPNMLIIGRIGQAIGASAVIVNTTALLTDAFPPRLLGIGIGFNASLSACSQLLGPLVGGAIVAEFGWRAIFLINGPIGLVALAWAYLVLERRPGSPQRESFDVTGAILFFVALACLTLALSLGGSLGWSSLPVLGCAAAGATVLLLFLLRQTRAATPLVPPELFADVERVVGYACVLLLPGVQISTALLIALFLQAVHGLGPLEAGLQVSVVAFGMMLAAPVAGRLLTHLSPFVLCAIGSLVTATGAAGLSITLSPVVPGHVIGSFAFIIGVGTGFFLTPNIAAIMPRVAPRQRGSANGLRSTLQNASGLLGTALVLAIVTAPLTEQSRQAVYAGTLSLVAGAEIQALVGGYRLAFAVLAGLCLASLGLQLSLPAMLRRRNAAAKAAGRSMPIDHPPSRAR